MRKTVPGDVEPIRTPRLILRALSDGDLDGFAALHADPRVTDRLGATLSRSESHSVLTRIKRTVEDGGLGPRAVELADGGGFVGLVGLSRPIFDAAFTPCVEVVWRVFPEYWGKGLATEAARASLDLGFRVLGLPAILAWTTPDNAASRRVMAKLGMTHDPADDFDHPRLPVGHPLRRHVLYRGRPDPA
jgi:ribosomal-protein-alanine N-acetyltransferase